MYRRSRVCAKPVQESRPDFAPATLPVAALTGYEQASTIGKESFTQIVLFGRPARRVAPYATAVAKNGRDRRCLFSQIRER